MLNKSVHRGASSCTTWGTQKIQTKISDTKLDKEKQTQWNLNEKKIKCMSSRWQGHAIMFSIY